MPETLLLGYQYDPRVHGYRSLTTGRTVARRRIVELLDAQLDQRANRLAQLTMSYASNDPDMSRGTWLAMMRDELRRAHLENAALGKGGWDRLTATDFGRCGYALRADYARLVTFAEQIRLGEVSEAQALNRLALYMGHARTQYWRAQRDSLQPKPGYILMARRRLGIAEHCAGCLILARAGWQPIEHMPIPGDGSTECLTNCKCTLETREVAAGNAAGLRGEWQ